jgi:hypothetical protein
VQLQSKAALAPMYVQVCHGPGGHRTKVVSQLQLLNW